MDLKKVERQMYLSDIGGKPRKIHWLDSGWSLWDVYGLKKRLTCTAKGFQHMKR